MLFLEASKNPSFVVASAGHAAPTCSIGLRPRDHAIGSNTRIILFGTHGKDVRTLPAGRRQVNIVKTMKREHSRKPDEVYDIIEACSWGPRLELFARGARKGWTTWGDQSEEYAPSWPTYANHSASTSLARGEPRKAESLNVLPARKNRRGKDDLAIEPALMDLTNPDPGFWDEMRDAMSPKRKPRAA